MINLDYKDWFINQKRIPDKDSNEAEDFFEFHKKICLDGCMVNGVFINPFLYWHLNMWNTEVDGIDEQGRISQKYMNPSLRDNEWVMTNAIHQANVEKKGLCIFGSRRISKSVHQASYIALGATFDENSQNIVSGLNSPDIKLITDKIDKGLNFLPWYYKWDRIEDNWKSQVTLGIKSKSGERYPFSSILIRNLDEGNNEEAIAGTKPRRLIIDEGGKNSFLRGLQAAIPGFTTPYGWGCSPLVFGTGGDMKKFHDAKTLMFNCEAFNFLEFLEEGTNRKHGLFLGHNYRMEAKKKSNLSEYLNKKGNDLEQIEILVSDFELAEKITNTNLEKAKKANDKQAYIKEKMYYPKTVDDIFLNENNNIYDIESCRKQKSKLLAEGNIGTSVEMYHDGDKVTWKFSDKMPITNFPMKPSDDKDAPVVIWEHPINDTPKWGLYTAGVDSYRQGKAAYSDSLGTVYIFKRAHDLMNDKYQYMFVASYAARPDKKEKWHEQARLLIKYYNALTLVENDENSFIDYMISKNDAHYLQEQPEFLKEWVPNTTVTRKYGIHRSSATIRDRLNTELKDYLEDVIYEEKDTEGSIIRQELGVKRILDPMLLEEIIQFNEDINVDRHVAACLAVTLANKLDPIYGIIDKQDGLVSQLYKKGRQKINTLFTDKQPTRIKNKKNTLWL